MCSNIAGERFSSAVKSWLNVQHTFAV